MPKVHITSLLIDKELWRRFIDLCTKDIVTYDARIEDLIKEYVEKRGKRGDREDVTLKCPSCGGSNWTVTRAGTRLFCNECYEEFKLTEVEKR